MRPIRSLLIAAAGAAGAAVGVIVPAPAAAAPRVHLVADQLGIVRQVALSARRVVWTRCVTADGPTEVWTALRTGGKPRRVPGIRVAGTCEPVRLVGVYGDLAVTLITGRSGQRRLDAVNVLTGRRTLIEADTDAASGYRITGADVDGARVVWQREIGAGDNRVSETVVGDLRAQPVGLYGAAPRRVVYTRSLRFGAVVPTGAWIGGDGAVVVRETISGAQYGYGIAEQRAMLVTPTGLSQYARLVAGSQVSDLDLTRPYLAYTVSSTTTGQVWIQLVNRSTRVKRRIRRLAGLPAAVPREVPAVPSPSITGRYVIWRERLASRGGYTDRVVAYDAGRRRITLVALVRDSRGQRAFVSQPSAAANRVAWAEMTLPTASGALGGYYGVSSDGARSRVLVRSVR